MLQRKETEIEADLAMSKLNNSNKYALWIRRYTYTHTYIYLFVGKREIIGEFSVLTLNLLVGLTPSVEIKTFRKLMKQLGSHAS